MAGAEVFDALWGKKRKMNSQNSNLGTFRVPPQLKPNPNPKPGDIERQKSKSSGIISKW